MAVTKKLTQVDLIFSYFQSNPNRDISHPEVVDWATHEWRKKTGEVFRDPDRAIRTLRQNGKLIKVEKGIYRYDPDASIHNQISVFTSAQKQEIFERDGHECVVCGQGQKHGVELHADHIRPKDQGGSSTVENGQTLCGRHNYLKTNLGYTEAGKKMLINFYESSKRERNGDLMNFFSELLEVYERHGIDEHIDWNK